MKTLKLTNKYREDGGSWMDATDATVNYARTLLAEMQIEEPANDWHLETRGTSSDWHRMEETAS